VGQTGIVGGQLQKFSGALRPKFFALPVFHILFHPRAGAYRGAYFPEIT